MSDAREPVGVRAVESFTVPARPPSVTFAGGRNKRDPVAVSLGRWTLPGLFSVFSHHAFPRGVPSLSNGSEARSEGDNPHRKQNKKNPEGCEQSSTTVALYLCLGSAPFTTWVMLSLGFSLQTLVMLRPLPDGWRHYKELLV